MTGRTAELAIGQQARDLEPVAQLAAKRRSRSFTRRERRGHPPKPTAPFPRALRSVEEKLVDLARLLAARRGDPVRIEAVSDPDDPDRDVYEKGGLLPGPDATLAGPTFEEWLGTTS